MEVDEEAAHATGQENTPTAANTRRWHEDTPGRQNDSAQQEGDSNQGRGTEVTVEVDKLANVKTLASVTTPPMVGPTW